MEAGARSTATKRPAQPGEPSSQPAAKKFKFSKSSASSQPAASTVTLSEARASGAVLLEGAPWCAALAGVGLTGGIHDVGFTVPAEMGGGPTPHVFKGVPAEQVAGRSDAAISKLLDELGTLPKGGHENDPDFGPMIHIYFLYCFNSATAKALYALHRPKLAGPTGSKTEPDILVKPRRTPDSEVSFIEIETDIKSAKTSSLAQLLTYVQRSHITGRSVHLLIDHSNVILIGVHPRSDYSDKIAWTVIAGGNYRDDTGKAVVRAYILGVLWLSGYFGPRPEPGLPPQISIVGARHRLAPKDPASNHWVVKAYGNNFKTKCPGEYAIAPNDEPRFFGSNKYVPPVEAMRVAWKAGGQHISAEPDLLWGEVVSSWSPAPSISLQVLSEGLPDGLPPHDMMIRFLAYRFAEGSHATTELRPFADLAMQLDALHKAGWLHCDVRQANIVFSSDGQHGTLIDFDMAVKTGGKYPRGYNKDLPERHQVFWGLAKHAMPDPRSWHDWWGLAFVFGLCFEEQLPGVKGDDGKLLTGDAKIRALLAGGSPLYHPAKQETQELYYLSLVAISDGKPHESPLLSGFFPPGWRQSSS